MAFTKATLTGTRDLIKAAWTKFNSLIDDLASTSSGKGASQIGVQDSASNMAADNVEDALAEIYTDVASPRTAWNTLDENSTTTTGLTWGFLGGLIRIDNSVITVTAGTISLTDDATNYIEIQSNGTVSRNTSGFTSGRIPLRQVVCSSGAQDTSTDKRAWFQGQTVPLTVAKGGSGIATLTDHGVLVGSGTSAITPLSVMTNGQLPIGKTGDDPQLAALTGTANQITIANAAGSITISIPSGAGITFANEGLHILESGASPTHDLIIKAGSVLGADRILTLTTGDAARTLSIEADSVINQDLSSDASPTFAGLTTTNQPTYTGNIIVPYSTFLPRTDTYAWIYGSVALKNNAAMGAQYYHAALILPNGITITKVTLYGSRDDASATMTLTLKRIDLVGGESDMATMTADWTSGYSSIYDDSISNAVIDTTTYMYGLLALLDPNDADTDVMLSGAKIEFTG